MECQTEMQTTARLEAAQGESRVIEECNWCRVCSVWAAAFGVQIPQQQENISLIKCEKLSCGTSLPHTFCFSLSVVDIDAKLATHCCH